MRKFVVVLAVCLAIVAAVWVLFKRRGNEEAEPARVSQSAAPESATLVSDRPVGALSNAAADDNWAATPEVVPCRDEPNAQRTPVLTSAIGARAFLEQKVAIVERKPDDMTCRAEWVLQVSKPGEDRFFAAKAYHRRERGITPDNMHSDSSLHYSGRVMGWSEDGRRLLAAAYVAAYEDWFQPYPLVYDMETGESRSIDLGELFAGHAPKGCDLYYDVRGFTPENKLLVAAEPFEYVEPKDCFASSVWIVDTDKNRMERAASPVQPILERLPLTQPRIP